MTTINRPERKYTEKYGIRHSANDEQWLYILRVTFRFSNSSIVVSIETPPAHQAICERLMQHQPACSDQHPIQTFVLSNIEFNLPYSICSIAFILRFRNSAISDLKIQELLHRWLMHILGSFERILLSIYYFPLLSRMKNRTLPYRIKEKEQKGERTVAPILVSFTWISSQFSSDLSYIGRSSNSKRSRVIDTVCKNFQTGLVSIDNPGQIEPQDLIGKNTISKILTVNVGVCQQSSTSIDHSRANCNPSNKDSNSIYFQTSRAKVDVTVLWKG